MNKTIAIGSCDIIDVVQAVFKDFFFWPAATSVSTLLPPTELRAENRIPDWRTAVRVWRHVSLDTCQMMTLVCDGLQSWNKEQEQGKAGKTLGICARVAFPGNQTKKKKWNLNSAWAEVKRKRCPVKYNYGRGIEQEDDIIKNTEEDWLNWSHKHGYCEMSSLHLTHPLLRSSGRPLCTQGPDPESHLCIWSRALHGRF